MKKEKQLSIHERMTFLSADAVHYTLSEGKKFTTNDTETFGPVMNSAKKRVSTKRIFHVKTVQGSNVSRSMRSGVIKDGKQEVNVYYNLEIERWCNE